MGRPLIKWCTKQRAAYKKTYEGKEYTHRVGAMTQERKNLLDKIGFDWCPANNNGKDVKWMVMYEQLVAHMVSRNSIIPRLPCRYSTQPHTAISLLTLE